MVVAYYTGIGSRRTPAPILAEMTRIARTLAARGYVLRSGGAPGADQAFEDGAESRAEIFVPWPSFERGLASYIVPSGEMLYEALSLVSKVHPAWRRVSTTARLLHARNAFQVFGRDLHSPSDFVILWATPEAGSVRGGTRTAFELARARSIPCYNLALADDRDRVVKAIGELGIS